MEEARATLRKWQDQVVDSDQRQIRQRRESANDVPRGSVAMVASVRQERCDPPLSIQLEETAWSTPRSAQVMQWDRDATKWRTEKITRVLQSFREAIAASAEITDRAVRGSVTAEPGCCESMALGWS